MKEFLKKYKYKILCLLIVFLVIFMISLLSLFIMMKLDIIYFQDGIQFNEHLFDRFKSSWYGYFVVILVHVLFTALLSFIPGSSVGFVILISIVYPKPWVAFLVAFIGVVLGSFFMYLLGRVGGYSLVKKILGKEDAEKAFNLLNNKLAIYFPLMMLFPVFPDNALVMIAGTMRMKLKMFIPSVVFCRGVGVATTVFGLAIVPFDKFTTPLHWIVFVFLCVIGVGAIFLGASRLNMLLERRRNEKENKE